MLDRAEAPTMSPAPAVQCSSCGFQWKSDSMAEGLRLLGSCPKCSGELSFRDAARRADRFDPAPAPAVRTAPHLVLGIPRR
jgi:hypothetical protein